MKRSIFYFFMSVTVASAFGDGITRPEEYKITIYPINVFEKLQKVDEITVPIYINGEVTQYTFYGVEVKQGAPVWVLDANANLDVWKDNLLAKCNEVGVPSFLSAKNIALWAELMAGIMDDGLKQQQIKDSELIDELIKDAGDDREEINQIKNDAKALDEEVKNKAASVTSSMKSLSQTITTAKNELNSLISENKSAIQRYAAELKSLEDDHSEEAELRKQEINDILAALGFANASALAANNLISAVSTKLANMETQLAKFALKDVVDKEMGDISIWNGYWPKNSRENVFTFIRPYKVDGSETYDETDTINNYLGDRGIVQYDTIEHQEARETAQTSRPPYAQWIEEVEGGEDGDGHNYGVPNKKSEAHNILPPANWVDGKTIIYTNGVYVAVSGGVANVNHDFVSVGTNMVEVMEDGKVKFVEKTEIRDFHTLNDKADPDEYDYLPNATYSLDETLSPPVQQFMIEWQTNDLAAVKKALGLKKSPKRSQLKNLNGSIRDEFFADDGLVQKVIGKTGVVERLNAAIKIENAWDNASIWTNGEAKVEVKGYHKAPHESVPVKITEFDPITGVIIDSAVEWDYLPIPDSFSANPYSTRYSSIDTINRYEDVNPESHRHGGTNVLTIAGFPSAEVDTVPVKVKEESPFAEEHYTIEWRPFAQSHALAFYGNDGASANTPVVVGAGSATNAVKFASAADSNVKVQCVREGNGGVKITIGVYYK